MFLNSILGFLSSGRKERNNALKTPSLKEEFLLTLETEPRHHEKGQSACFVFEYHLALPVFSCVEPAS